MPLLTLGGTWSQMSLMQVPLSYRLPPELNGVPLWVIRDGSTVYFRPQ